MSSLSLLLVGRDRPSPLWAHSSFGAFFFIFVASACSGAGGGDGEGAPDGNGRFAKLHLEVAYPEAFSYLSGIRELQDGRLLAADPMSGVLLRIDLEAGRADTLAGEGEGPQEHRKPDRVFPLPNDSTLLVDLGNSRLTVVDPEGRFVDWIPMFRQMENGRARSIHPRFVDAAGFIYLTAVDPAGSGPGDSTGVARFSRGGEAETVVAWGWHPDFTARRSGGGRPIFSESDDWAVGMDGRVAVVRANGYSVDWYLPDGSVVQGPPNEAETYPLEQSEMDAEVHLMQTEALMTFVTAGENGVESRQTSRGIPRGSGVDLGDFFWPETLPLFRGGGTWVSPMGEAWVQRIMPAAHPSRYEVFDGNGLRLGFVELDPGSKLVGFGSRSGGENTVYLARTDEVGLVWLSRYRVEREGA